MFRHSSEHPFIAVNQAGDVLVWGVTKYPMLITKEVAAQMKRDRPRSLELELVLLQEDVNDGLWILADNDEVIHVDSEVFVVISPVSHPDVPFALGEEKSHFPQNIRKFFTPSKSTRIQPI